MNEKYNAEFEKLRESFKKEATITIKKVDDEYNKLEKELGSANFLSHSINRPLNELEQKYKIKFEELRKKYNK